MIRTAVCKPPRSCQTTPSQGYLAQKQPRQMDGRRGLDASHAQEAAAATEHNPGVRLDNVPQRRAGRCIARIAFQRWSSSDSEPW